MLARREEHFIVLGLHEFHDQCVAVTPRWSPASARTNLASLLVLAESIGSNIFFISDTDSTSLHSDSIRSYCLSYDNTTRNPNPSTTTLSEYT